MDKLYALLIGVNAACLGFMGGRYFQKGLNGDVIQGQGEIIQKQEKVIRGYCELTDHFKNFQKERDLIKKFKEIDANGDGRKDLGVIYGEGSVDIYLRREDGVYESFMGILQRDPERFELELDKIINNLEEL